MTAQGITGRGRRKLWERLRFVNRAQNVAGQGPCGYVPLILPASRTWEEHDRRVAPVNLGGQRAVSKGVHFAAIRVTVAYGPAGGTPAHQNGRMGARKSTETLMLGPLRHVRLSFPRPANRARVRVGAAARRPYSSMARGLLSVDGGELWKILTARSEPAPEIGPMAGTLIVLED